jgi:hypothetical protein
MAWPYKYETGVTCYDRAKAFEGYTVVVPFPPRAVENAGEIEGKVYLMDMQGKVVHKWTAPYPVWYARLMPDGNLVCALRDAKPIEGRPGYGDYHMGGANGRLVELDWNSSILFQHFDPGMHHDFRKLENGNYIYVGWEKVPDDLAKKVRGGMKGTEHKDGSMFGDFYREINPAGQTVWEWHGIEHFDPEIEIIGSIHVREEWTHVNDVDVMPDGNILSDSRHTDGAFIIDRSSGEITWRWGNVAYLDEKSGQIEHHDVRQDIYMGGPHDAHRIPDGLPGAGNMLVYDNGMYRYMSRALEVDIQSGEVVWQSEGEFGVEGYVAGRVHFSPFISGSQRQPNGNTMICSGGNGVIYEMTPEKEIVWHYVRATPGQGDVCWGIFRAYKYGVDFCPQFRNLPAPVGELL